MRSIFAFINILFFSLLFCAAQSQINIGLLTSQHLKNSQNEVSAAYGFLKSMDQYNPSLINIEDIKSFEDIQNINLIWFHHTDSTFSLQNQEVKEILDQFLRNGGKMLLTLEAFRSINDLELEPIRVESRMKLAEDGGYGRKLGLHAFRFHPVFDGLNGGAYIFKPHQDTSLRINGFFNENVPLNGAVVAVDWDYIFFRENVKLAVEYWTGKGKVLAIGAYTILSEPNINRQHLELFLANCFEYLLEKKDDSPIDHWTYYPQEVIPFESDHLEVVERNSILWENDKSDFSIIKEMATENYCEVAGERMLMMGKESGGIDEIWSHPFMAFRDYEVGIKFSNLDSVFWLNNQTPSIEVRPESFTRNYSFDRIDLTETMVASKKEPVGVVHYKFSGNEPCDLFIKFKSNLRLMWPYSEAVMKTLKYAYDINLNSVIVTDESEDFACLMGSNKEPDNVLAGQYEDFEISWDEGEYCQIREITSDEFLISGIWQFKLFPNEEFDIVFTAGYTPAENDAINNAIQQYKEVIENTSAVYEQALGNNNSLFSKSLIISTPNQQFNDGYKWALESTDRFFVNTPGLGSSLVAGYNTTNTGWDGGHTIDGRPGYSWYFGRDGQWSGFALLDYGDFNKVKAILKMYQDFQDLNGKIYHEISTSGVMHYDAADATPLYIILAGKYLKHSGDIEFIRESWAHIQKAIDFCFSTDSDGDHLIENTNVGHGWVEGGHLFGSHSSLYLISCWAAALEEASYMAKALKIDEVEKQYRKEAGIVKEIIRSDFYDGKEFFYQGKYKDGTYHTTQSIMPSISMHFKQIEEEKAQKLLPSFASNNYSSDWGCRIIGKDSPQFHPRGYHTGSVWPLYTGWVSLAEFNYGQEVQGFTHIMNNLLTYQHWGLGYIEEVLHGKIYKPAGVCRHQCWSETMVLQPAIEGMLGFEPDAMNHSFSLSPKFPANWDSIQVQNIKVGEHSIDFSMKREDNVILYNFQHIGPSSIQLDFDPILPMGTRIIGINVKGDFEPVRLNTSVPSNVYLSDSLTLEYKIEGGIKILPVIPHPMPGDSSTSLRILSDHFEDNIYSFSLEDFPNTTKTVDVYVNDWEIKEIYGGKLLSKEGNVCRIEVNFMGSEWQYYGSIVKIILEKNIEKYNQD